MLADDDLDAVALETVETVETIEPGAAFVKHAVEAYCPAVGDILASAVEAGDCKAIEQFKIPPCASHPYFIHRAKTGSIIQLNRNFPPQHRA